jgi:hypothetical protein
MLAFLQSMQPDHSVDWSAKTLFALEDAVCWGLVSAHVETQQTKVLHLSQVLYEYKRHVLYQWCHAQFGWPDGLMLHAALWQELESYWAIGGPLRMACDPPGALAPLDLRHRVHMSVPFLLLLDSASRDRLLDFVHAHWLWKVFYPEDDVQALLQQHQYLAVDHRYGLPAHLREVRPEQLRLRRSGLCIIH